MEKLNERSSEFGQTFEAANLTGQTEQAGQTEQTGQTDAE
jgi:hypothetical protein